MPHRLEHFAFLGQTALLAALLVAGVPGWIVFLAFLGWAFLGVVSATIPD